MSNEEHREKLKSFFATAGSWTHDIDNALYAISEVGGIWPDAVDSVSPEQAFLCWQVVEKLRKERFPAELGM